MQAKSVVNSPGNIEKQTRDFQSSIPDDSTTVLTASKKRRYRYQRAFQSLIDGKIKAEIALDEQREAFEEKLSAQKEVYSAVAERYRSDCQSKDQRISALRSELDELKDASETDKLQQTQLELQNAKRQIQKLERSKRDLATGNLTRYFDSQRNENVQAHFTARRTLP